MHFNTELCRAFSFPLAFFFHFLHPELSKRPANSTIYTVFPLIFPCHFFISISLAVLSSHFIHAPLPFISWRTSFSSRMITFLIYIVVPTVKLQLGEILSTFRRCSLIHFFAPIRFRFRFSQRRTDYLLSLLASF